MFVRVGKTDYNVEALKGRSLDELCSIFPNRRREHLAELYELLNPSDEAPKKGKRKKK